MGDLYAPSYLSQPVTKCTASKEQHTSCESKKGRKSCWSVGSHRSDPETDRNRCLRVTSESFLKPKCCQTSPFSQCKVNQDVTGEPFSFHTDCLLCLQPPMGEEGGRRRHHSTSAGDEGRRRRHPSNSTSKPTQAAVTAAQNTPKDSTQKTAATGQGKKSESGARGKKESAKKWSPLA